MQTIKQLRQSGYKVRVIHERGFTTHPTIAGERKVLSSRGGKTLVEITDLDSFSAIGVARCSDEENFNKKIGNKIALGRAIKNLENTRKVVLTKEV